MISINTSVNKVVNVRALISSCKEIVQPPEINVSFPVSAKAIVLVIVFYYSDIWFSPKSREGISDFIFAGK